MERLYILIDGLKISYLRGGQGTPLLFLHGGGTEASTYLSILATLSKTHMVIAPDIPLFGKSDIPKRTYTFEDYADLFIQFLDTLKMSKTTVIGYSFGGGIAARMYNGENIDKIILCSPATQDLKVKMKDLKEIVFDELFRALQRYKAKKEKQILLTIVVDFVKNVTKCKDKLLMPSVIIKCLNAEFVIPDDKRMEVFVSSNDNIFKSNKYKLLSPNIHLNKVNGTHLWPLLNEKEFFKVIKIL